jgi:hypothetical protein
MHQTYLSAPPESLVDAMQTGDRLGYHPERALEEIAHFHEVLPKAQTEVDKLNTNFVPLITAYVKRKSAGSGLTDSVDLDVQKHHRIDAMVKAESLAAEAGK